MEYRVFSPHNIKASFLGFGCWAVGGEKGWNNASDRDSLAAIRCAAQSGVNFFDAAPVYGFGYSESFLGKALQGIRGGVMIATKCGLSWTGAGKIYNDLSQKRILEEIDESLQRLNTDYIDIYQCHWPDPNTPIQETAEAIRSIIDAGKVRYFGVTNFSLEDTQKLASWLPLVSYQGLLNALEWNPQEYHSIPLAYKSRSEILPYCEASGLGFLPYSPLMQGLLTGSFGPNPENNFNKNDVRSANPKLSGAEYPVYYKTAEDLKKLSQEYGYSLTEFAYMWLKSHKAIASVISGAQNEKQVTANLKASSVEVLPELLMRADALVKKNINNV